MTSWRFADNNADKNNQVKGVAGAIGGANLGAAGIYSSETAARHPIGYRMAFEDGRVFRYAHFVSAVNVGRLAAQDASVTQTLETAATTVRNSGGTAADIASGATSLYLLDTDLITATNSDDVFAGGYLHVINSDTGGYTYRIRSNAYTASTSVMQVDLYDATVAAITSESEVAVTGNMYGNLAIANNGTDDAVAGVAMATQAAADFGWVQTWGPATVLADESAGTVARGTIATLSDGVNGAIQPLSGGGNSSNTSHLLTEPILGWFLTDATDGNFAGVYLQIAP